MALHTRRGLLAATGAALSAAGCLNAPPGPGQGTPSIDGVERDWPLPRMDPAGTRFDPGGSVPETEPGVAWTATSEGRWGTPVVADGTVYVGTEVELVALDAATGERRWSTALDADDGTAGPAVGRALYVAVDDELRALSPADGSRRWTLSLGSRVRRIVPAGDTVFATTDGFSDDRGAVVAVADGTLRWRHDADSASTPAFGSLAVDDGGVYAVAESSASATRHLALERATGAVRWRTIGLNHSRALTVADGAVLAGDFFGQVVAQATADGGRRWEQEVRPAVRELCAGPDRAFAASSADEPDALAALSLADGTGNWRGRGRHVVGAGDAVVGLGRGSIRCYDRASGDLRWERHGGPGVDGVALADGVLVIAAEDGSIRALAGRS